MEPLRPPLPGRQEIDAGQQQLLPTRLMKVHGTDCIVSHGDVCETGLIGDDLDSAGRIGIMICNIGDLPTGIGILFTPPPDSARRLANALIALADRVEALAADRAAAVIARAQGRANG